MTGNYFDPMWTAKVTVPVKCVGERWEFSLSQSFPANRPQP